MCEHYETIPIVFIKEYYWCPIQAYLKLTTWQEKPTPSMEEGGLDGYTRPKLLEKLAKIEDLDKALTYWELPVESKRLCISGRIDLLLDYGSQVVIVEAKTSMTKTRLVRHGLHVQAQLAAYTIAVEETMRKPVVKTYIYSIEHDNLYQVRIKPYHRKLVEEAVETLRGLVRGEVEPQTLPRPPRSRCRVCSYRTVCPLRLS